MSEHGHNSENNYTKGTPLQNLAASIILGIIFTTAQIIYTMFLITFQLLTLLVRK